MTPAPGWHLSAEDLDAWLAGALSPDAQSHLDRCPECLERTQAEQEIVSLLSALPLMSPSAGFADRVMISVAVPDPFALRSLESTRRRLFASRRTVALAASVALLLVCSMTASIVWTLGHQQSLAAFGSWLAGEAGRAAWLTVRGLASNFIEQPWYAGFRNLAAHPTRLGLASAAASLAYIGGLVALRRLLALPTQRAAHASV
jgi:hypothetical protein